MKISKLFGSALFAISLCFSSCDEIRTQAGLNTDIDGDGVIDGTIPSNPSTPSIKPQKIEMNGVQGFAIVENTSNAPRTKANINGDGVDDDMLNGNESEAVNTSPYALYTIDENGELHASIFYFEVVPSEDGSTDVSNTDVLKEISNALQIVPSLVTDLGKYILFSGCEYHIVDTEISDEARAICESFIQNNMWGHRVYMIRKSDGALFDLSNQSIFTYSYMEPIDEFMGIYNHWFSPQYVNYNALNQYIPTYRYMISPKGNLFAQSCCDDHISQIVDNGDAIDLKQLSQDYDINSLPRFIVDKSENIYLYYDLGIYRNIDIYFSDGGFDSIDITSDCHMFFDMKVDNNGGAYIFFLENHDSGPYIKAGILSNGKYVESSGISIPGYTHTPYATYGGVPVIYPHYIGFSNGDFKWFLSQEFWSDYYNNEPTKTFKTITYNKDSDEWILKDLPKELYDLLTKRYDSLLCGIKSYGVNVSSNLIEVSEIDIENESSRQYTFNIDLSFIKSQRYIATTLNGSPYLIINGKNSDSGANISLKINLTNGENNSTFAPDGRNVVSFYRIN